MSYVGNKFLILILDNKKLDEGGSDMCWSEFSKKKQDLTNAVNDFYNILEKK